MPAALAQQALAQQAATLHAGATSSALALVAERLAPEARAALQAFLRRAQETATGSAPAPTTGRLRPVPLPGPGERVGAYVVERELGRGGMGAVFVATHVELGRRVALKLLLAGADPRHAERFAREGQAVARLEHPGIVGLHEVGADAAGRRFLAMQLVDGESLQARLERGGPLPQREAARLTLEVARALEYAHERGLLHRDLKPHNVLVDAQGRARLTDFGLARDARDVGLTTTGELLGTPAYMAPEQAAGERGQVDVRSDVYGVGATLYHLLTGHPPFEAPTLVNTITMVLTRPPRPPRDLRPDVAPALEAICLRCLEKEPAARYPGCAALAEDLERFLAGGAVTAPARPRRGAALAAAGVVALLGAGALAARSPRAARPRAPARARLPRRPSRPSARPLPARRRRPRPRRRRR